MIQRIQTLYMLIVTALMAVTLFAPLAWFAGEAGEFGLYAFSLKTAAGEAVQPTVYMGVVVEMVLLVGSAVMEGVYYFLSYRVFAEQTFHTQVLKPAVVLPLVCLLFAYLAARAVFRDELMVRAADRIR